MRIQPVRRHALRPVLRPLKMPVIAGDALGPELALPFDSGQWVSSDPSTVIIMSDRVRFTGAANLANARQPALAIENGATYQIKVSVAGRTTGQGQVIVAGDTSNHQGLVAYSGNGNFVAQLTATATGANVDAILLRASGTSTTLDMLLLSVRKILHPVS